MKDFVAQQIGIPSALKELDLAKEAGAIAVENSLVHSGETLLKISLPLCPIDTGHLRETGQVKVEGIGFDTKVTVGYDADYAIYVHEDLEKYHAPPTQAKFLSEPYNRYKDDIQKNLERELEEAIAKAKRLEKAERKRQQRKRIAAMKARREEKRRAAHNKGNRRK